MVSNPYLPSSGGPYGGHWSVFWRNIAFTPAIKHGFYKWSFEHVWKNKKSISWKRKYGDFGYQIRSISVIKRLYQRFLSSKRHSKSLDQVIQSDLLIPDRWRSLNPLKGSQNLHPKKVTAWITWDGAFSCFKLSLRPPDRLSISKFSATLPFDSASWGKQNSNQPIQCGPLLFINWVITPISSVITPVTRL